MSKKAKRAKEERTKTEKGSLDWPKNWTPSHKKEWTKKEQVTEIHRMLKMGSTKAKVVAHA